MKERFVIEMEIELDNETGKMTLLDEIRMIQTGLFVWFTAFGNMTQNWRSGQDCTSYFKVLFLGFLFARGGELSPDHNEECVRIVVEYIEIGFSSIYVV